MSSKKAKPAAVVAKPAPKLTAEERKRPSTVEQPVAVTWVTCLNLEVDDAPVLRRGELHRAVYDAGVNYSTARTQVDRYLRWHNNGRVVADLPTSVTFE